MTLFPISAAFNPNSFVEKYLHPTMSYLLLQLKKDRDRLIAFISIGKICVAVGSSIGPYLEAILQSVRENLASKLKTKASGEINAVFECIQSLAAAVGQALTRHMHELLDQMFAVGLSEGLVNALVDLGIHIPPLLPIIQG